jgi:hypothetical protein
VHRMGQGSSLTAKSVLTQWLGGLGEGGHGVTGIWGQEWRWLGAMTHHGGGGVACGEEGVVRSSYRCGEAQRTQVTGGTAQRA